MKKYLAIGHWDGNSNQTCVADCAATKAAFTDELKCNGFRAWVVLTEKAVAEFESMNSFEIYEKVMKLTTNYRKWNDIVDYIDQCMDIMTSKLSKAEY